MNSFQKEAAQRYAGVVAQMAPYIERDQLIPWETLDDVRTVLGEADGEMLVTGALRSCGLALNRLASMGRKVTPSLAAAELSTTIAKLRVGDQLSVGDQAYVDGSRLAVVMAAAMETNSRVDLPGEFGTSTRIVKACLVLLIATLRDLGLQFGMTLSQAARRFTLDIAELQPTDG